MSFDISRSGLTTATGKLRATAHNVANVATPGFTQSRVDTVDMGSPANGGGVRIAAITPSASHGLSDDSANVNLEEQLLALKQTRYDFTANTKVIKTTSELLGTLLDEKA